MKLIHKFFALITIVLSSVTFADWTTQEDNWYIVTIEGVKSGWAREFVEVDQETGNLKTNIVQNMTLSRAGIEISISVTSAFLETAEGKPISVENSQEAMGQLQHTTWKFEEDSIEMTTIAGGAPMVKKVPLPEETWLTPQAVKRLFTKKMKDGAIEITYQTMSAELGPTAVTVVMTKKGESTHDVLGKELKVSSWETVNDKMPIIGTEYYSAQGLNVGSSMNAGLGAIESRLALKHEALSPVNEVPELMDEFIC